VQFTHYQKRIFSELPQSLPWNQKIRKSIALSSYKSNRIPECQQHIRTEHRRANNNPTEFSKSHTETRTKRRLPGRYTHARKTSSTNHKRASRRKNGFSLLHIPIHDKQIQRQTWRRRPGTYCIIPATSS
jgi:hypothetical protein